MIPGRRLPLKTLALSAATIAALALAATAGRDLLIYNHSQSIPQGLYIRTDSPLARGAIVTVRAVTAAPAMVREHDFTDPGDRFIKRIAATAGDQVCGLGDTITINGRVVARRLRRDSAGRALPRWSGCRILGVRDVLLLGDTPDSFDGRYWGVASRDQIEGVWRPLHF